MKERPGIKVIKKKDTAARNARPAKRVRRAPTTAEVVTSTVSGWVDDHGQRKAVDSRIAVDDLFGPSPEATED